MIYEGRQLFKLTVMEGGRAQVGLLVGVQQAAHSEKAHPTERTKLASTTDQVVVLFHLYFNK